MKHQNISRKEHRLARHHRILQKHKTYCLFRPALVITKTNQHIFAQLIDWSTNKTIAASSSVQLKLKNGNKVNAAKVGTDIGNKIKALNITKISFDTGGSKYHGRISALADAVRATGIQF